MRIALSLLSLLVLISSGCWYYSFTETPYPDLESLEIEYLSNNTTEYDLADIITQELIDEIEQSGMMKVVSQGADAKMSGSVNKYERSVHSYTEDEQPEEYRVTIGVRLQLYNQKSDKSLWERNFEAYGTYEAEDDDAEAREEAIELLLQRILEGLREG